MRLRYVCLALILAGVSPYIKDTVVYAAEVKATYDQVQAIKQTDVVTRLAQQ